MAERGVRSSYGLTSQQALQKLALVGKNELKTERQRSIYLLLLEQFTSPLVLLLLAATALSVFLGEVREAVAIGAVLIINAFIGFVQEYRADTAIAALQQMTAPRATVVRDGSLQVVAANTVVTGDALWLEGGDIVAADATLIEASRLQVNEAVLTGESLPVHKSCVDTAVDESAINRAEQRDLSVFMGTAVLSGTGLAVVKATGMATELGRIASLLETAASEPTPLQLQLARVGHSLVWLSLGIMAVVGAIGWYQSMPWLELVIYALSLAVAAVPEGMPAIVTVALALGVQRLARQNALIRKLPSVETLGSVSVICTDKTGTLTSGKMQVREVWGAANHEVLRAAALCTDAEFDAQTGRGSGDPTEIAILAAAYASGTSLPALETEAPRLSSEPFDTERRRMSVYRADGINYVKGAVETIVGLCTAGPLSDAKEAASKMAALGLRVLAVATGPSPTEKELRLIGLIGLADPPRPEAAAAINEARRAGIVPVMITGDHPSTAAAIAKELGLIVADDDISKRVHARATPADKLKLVREWKSLGHVVAMTGDGVNDAPALKEAHIGIAMGRAGTEVTRQAADMILADDNFATIVTAVREGRGIFQNIRRAIVYLLTGNFAELMVVIGALIMGMPLPLLAAHLLWINLVTDSLPAITLILDPADAKLMRSPPRPKGEALLGRNQWQWIIWIGFIEAASALALYNYDLQEAGAEHARGLIFTTIVFSQLIRSFSARSENFGVFSFNLRSNIWQPILVIVAGLMQMVLHFLPFTRSLFALTALSTRDLFLIIPVSLISTLAMELTKLVASKEESLLRAK